MKEVLYTYYDASANNHQIYYKDGTNHTDDNSSHITYWKIENDMVYWRHTNFHQWRNVDTYLDMDEEEIKGLKLAYALENSILK